MSLSNLRTFYPNSFPHIIYPIAVLCEKTLMPGILFKWTQLAFFLRKANALNIFLQRWYFAGLFQNHWDLGSLCHEKLGFYSQLITVSGSFKKSVHVVSRSLIKVMGLTDCLHQECLSVWYKAKHLIMQAASTQNRYILKLASAFLFFPRLRESLQGCFGALFTVQIENRKKISM